MDLSTTYLGLDLPHPLMPGASPLADDLEIGVIFGLTAAVAVLARPPVGRAMDLRGRRVVILVGGALHALVCALYLTVSGMGPWIYALRVAHGLAFDSALGDPGLAGGLLNTVTSRDPVNVLMRAMSLVPSPLKSAITQWAPKVAAKAPLPIRAVPSSTKYPGFAAP